MVIGCGASVFALAPLKRYMLPHTAALKTGNERHFLREMGLVNGIVPLSDCAILIAMVA